MSWLRQKLSGFLRKHLEAFFCVYNTNLDATLCVRSCSIIFGTSTIKNNAGINIESDSSLRLQEHEPKLNEEVLRTMRHNTIIPVSNLNDARSHE